MALALLIRVWWGREARWKGNLAGWGILVFLAAVSLTTLSAIQIGYSWIQLEKLLKMGVIAVCVAIVMNSRADIRAFVCGWACIMAVYQLKSLQEYFFAGRGVWRMGFWRLIGIESTNGDPNTFAAKSLLLAPFVVGLYRTSRKPGGKAWWILCLGLIGVVVVLTGSRAALVCSVAYALLVLLTGRRKLVSLAALFVVFLVAWVALPEAIRLRYRTIVNPEINEAATVSGEARILGLKRGVYLFARRPLTGVGPGCFVISHHVYGTYLEETFGYQPHSLPGQLLGETGLLGTLGFLVLLLGTFLAGARTVRALRGRARDGPADVLRELASAGMLSTILSLAFGAFGHNLYEYNWLWVAAILSAGAWLAARFPEPPSSTDAPPRTAGRGGRTRGVTTRRGWRAAGHGLERERGPRYDFVISTVRRVIAGELEWLRLARRSLTEAARRLRIVECISGSGRSRARMETAPGRYKPMRRSGVSLAPLAVVCVVSMASIGPSGAAVAVSTCDNYPLSTAGETYVLQNDCTAPRTAFIVTQNNVVLDLNGHTVTYGNDNYVEVPNHGFESCSGGVPASWDLSAASGAACVAKSLYYGSYELQVSMTSSPKTVRSGTVTLPANKTFVAFAWAKGGSSDSATLRVRRASDGTVLASYTRTDLGRGFAICDPYDGLAIPASTSAQAVYLDLQLTSGGGTITVDEMDIKATRDYGVVSGGYHDTRYHPDLPAGTPVYGANLTVKNGTIRQGQGRGALSPAVRTDTMPVVLDNVALDVNGVHTSAFLTTGGAGGIQIRNNTRMSSSSWGVFDRMHLCNVANVARVCGNIMIQNSVFTGGAQGGIFVPRVRTDSGCSDSDTMLIEGNTIQHNETVTNGYGIHGNGWVNATIRNNTIQPTLGRGIMIDASEYYERSTNVEIYGNLIEVKEKPNFEFSAANLQTAGIRLRSYSGSANQNIHIHDNTIRSYTGPTYVSEANGITVNAASGADVIRIANNDIKVWSSYADYRAYAILMQSIATGNDIVVEGNQLESNTYCLRMGNSDGFSTTGVRFRSNTFRKGAEFWGGTFHTSYYGYSMGTQTNNDFLDGQYGADTSASDVVWDGSSNDMTVSWYLAVIVQNDDGTRLSGVSVTATDAAGTPTTATTDATGTAKLALRAYRRSGGGSTYQYFTPYQVVASAGGETSTSTVSLSASTTLTFTLGVDGSTDPPPPTVTGTVRTDVR